MMLELEQALKPRPAPTSSVTLTPADSQVPAHGLRCDCQLCSTFQARKLSQLLEMRTLRVNKKIVQKSKNKHRQCTPYYSWLIQHLVLPHNKIISRGIDVWVPEVLFYEEGEISHLFCNKEVDQPVVKRAGKDKLSGTFIMKIFGDRRRRYRDMVNGFLGRKKEVAKKSKLDHKKQPKKQPKDGVIIKFVDGLEQLITENEFLHLLQRRKQDSIWKTIHSIKNYIPVQSPAEQILVAKYRRDRIKYESLHRRACKLMRVYGMNIIPGDPDFITDEEQIAFCRALLKESKAIFVEYLAYKMVAYIEQFFDERILALTAEFLVNEMGHGYLSDVMRLETQGLVKYTWTNEAYMNKINQEEEKLLTRPINTDEEVLRNAEMIEGQMGAEYEKMKQAYGLSNEEEDDKQEIANNEFWRVLYPDLKKPLSQILRDKNMTPNKFKRTYLGFKEKKKPIVRPFTSKLIQSLHNMTPQFIKAEPHDYITKPTRTISTAFSRSSSYNTRSYSVNKTSVFSTTCKTSFRTPRDY